jgi:muramidase (phage lysozyme)
MTSPSGSLPNGDYYTLPLGSAALDDGQLVLKTLRRQKEKRKNPYRILSTDTLFRGLAHPMAILSVKMKILTNNSSLSGSLLRWSSSPTPLIRKLFLFSFIFILKGDSLNE